MNLFITPTFYISSQFNVYIDVIDMQISKAVVLNSFPHGRFGS